MSASYDSTLATGKDWVRFLTRDTDTTDASISDEEIEAVLDMQTASAPASYYFAAAEVLSLRLAEQAMVGEGKQRKMVEHLQIEWGMESNVVEAIDKHICWLRERGAFLLAPRPRALRAVGRSTTRDVRFPTR